MQRKGKLKTNHDFLLKVSVLLELRAHHTWTLPAANFSN